ncbi:hypothetical protein L226DRAFT_537180 [Lentinus tigrinus ALCF2SS1-7]|uniref:Uncharacterized protein n=1 Tax=Lentinus tigrinus ALCF2SS1-6 TaxID=1328759 RepID=A0A5C2RNF2_9APHY|nr:hypothetical protein L227DRAFT_581639 [Lentinus tigrinus ALCF2SS1-6]RPD72351.1 hypothetical protein L226DRAFT_537180 [Lentinus tigrinus ALCF2SS1-7]
MITKQDSPPPYTPAPDGASTSYPPPPGQPPMSDFFPVPPQPPQAPPEYPKAIDSQPRKRESSRDSYRSLILTALALSLLFFVVAGLFVFAISIPFALVGARILGYPTQPLTDRYQSDWYYYNGYYGGRYAGLSGQFSRALAAGTSVLVAGLMVLAWIAGVFWVIRGEESTGGLALFFTVVVGGCAIAAAIVPGVGVALRPVTDFSTRHAFASGGVGFAVLGGSVAVVLVCVIYLMSRR